MKISIFTLGCKTNLYESGQIANSCRQLGHEVSMHLCEADVYIINTCAITGAAEKKSRQAIFRARKYNSNCKIIVVGCASQKNSEQFSDLENVTVVCGTANKQSIASLLGEHVVAIEPLPTTYEDTIPSTPERVRSFIKLQDGCNNFCSYCIVPYLRGRSRSRSIDDVLSEINASKASEIVLIGIDISQYGKDIGSSLTELLLALKHVKARIRLGSFEVGVVDEAFVDALAGVDICPHFHLSLQSGSDEVLKRMNRHYTTSQYLSAVKLLESRLPNVAITTDLIVGFSGEEELHHQQTMNFAREVGFADIHVFPYSPREGTVAYQWQDTDGNVKAKRVHELTEVKEQLIANFLSSQVGTHAKVLVQKVTRGICQGYSANYCHVSFEGKAEVGEVVDVVITSVQGNTLQGEKQ